MSGFKMALLAAAAAAVVAIAVVALPAIGDSRTNGAEHSEESALAACLAAHGLTGAPTAGPELKAWLVDKEAADPTGVKAAIVACDRGVPDLGASRPDVQAMITCVRSHGIDAPTAPEDFKRWVGEQQRLKALQEALTACKMALAPAAKPGGPANPDCGAPAEKAAPPTDKPKQPASPSDTNGM
jgi:hypothetical protein